MKIFYKIYYFLYGIYRIFFPIIYFSNYVDTNFEKFKINKIRYSKNIEIFYEHFRSTIPYDEIKKVFPKNIFLKILNKKKINYKKKYIKNLLNIKLNFEQWLFLYKFSIRLGYFFLAKSFKNMAFKEILNNFNNDKIKSSVYFESSKFKESLKLLPTSSKNNNEFRYLLKTIIRKKNFLNLLDKNSKLFELVNKKKILIIAPIKKKINYEKYIKKCDTVFLFGYISKSQYNFLDLNGKKVATYLSGNNALKIINLKYNINTNLDLLLFKEKSQKIKYKKIMNRKIISDYCKYKFQNYLTGNLSGLQILLLNLLINNPKEIQVVGADLFITHGLKKQIKNHNFLFKNMHKEEGLLKSFTDHDLNFIFILTKYIFNLKILKADKYLKNIIRLSINKYNSILENQFKGVDY